MKRDANLHIPVYTIQFKKHKEKAIIKTNWGTFGRYGPNFFSRLFINLHTLKSSNLGFKHFIMK